GRGLVCLCRLQGLGAQGAHERTGLELVGDLDGSNGLASVVVAVAGLDAVDHAVPAVGTAGGGGGDELAAVLVRGVELDAPGDEEGSETFPVWGIGRHVTLLGVGGR